MTPEEEIKIKELELVIAEQEVAEKSIILAMKKLDLKKGDYEKSLETLKIKTEENKQKLIQLKK